MPRKMKDSGVAWLGQIPAEWEVAKIKSFLTNKVEKNHPDDMVLSLYRDHGVVPKESRDDNHNVTSEDTAQYKYVQSGDLVINKMKAWQGSLALSSYDGIVSPAYYVCKITGAGMSPRFIHYLVRNQSLAQEFERLSTGMRVGQWDLNIHDFLRVEVLRPPLSEQRAIASYLDDKCGAIDEAIAEAKKGIEEYKAWKKSLIFEMVTGKRRVDGGSYKMKPSGIPWIGDVPKGWEVYKTLFGLSMPITDGPHTTPELFDDGVPFVSAEAVSCGNGGIDFNHIRGYISEAFYEECCEKYVPLRNDIYMIKSGATTGRVAIVDTDRKFTIWSPLAVFRCNPKRLLPRFAFYYLQSSAYQGQVELAWSFGTQQNIGMRALEQLKLLVPSLQEQHAIADYLDEKCGAIDALVAEKEALISDLEAYKKSLIYEVVTGKREVA